MEEERASRPAGPPKELKHISEVVWEIPASYKKGMLVPARLYATKNLMQGMDAGVFEQVTNVACLPGIQKYSYCMPDGHWGYGFPIGGVAAFDPKEGGVISPGGIGFDINCLVKGSKILTDFGYTKQIENFESDFVEVESFNSPYSLKSQKCTKCILSFDANQKYFFPKAIGYFMKKKHLGQISQVQTKLGYFIKVTEDHPLLTKAGMIESGKLQKETEIAVYPFEGVPYQEVRDKILVGDDAVFTKQEKEELIKRNLFPLNLKNEKIPLLTKLFGYLLGDGQIYLSGKKGFVCAYGPEEDLKNIKNDLEKLGFSAGIYGRERNHSVPTRYGLVEFTNMTYELHLSSKSLARLFFLLGYPKGVKTNTLFLVPDWISQSPLWIKRLFLSGLFGAELSKPRTHTKTGFDCPTLSLNKNTRLLDNARDFCIQLMAMLEEFGINTHKLLERDDYQNKHGKTSRLKLQISSEEENLLRLWSTLGFSYNKKREFLSHAAILYIKEKKMLASKREEIAKKIKEYKTTGLKLHEIQRLLNSSITNNRFIARHFYNDAGYRITLDFPSFNDFVKIKTAEFEKYGCFFDSIEKINKEGYGDYVYDFNIPDTHTFIAENFIVSNCGMRLVTTNLPLKDVQPKLKSLVDLLFKIVPSGVGGKGFVDVDKKQFTEVMHHGAGWCVKNGYGWEEDLERIEESGRIKQADPSKVSEKAVSRGINQLGTLGSGNHYLEVQFAAAANIFDEKAAKRCGIHTPDQIVFMVHCGSRGFGHQIGTDYLKLFLEVMPKYGIKILDQELSCAPFNSQEGQDYYGAMACAANMAFANRQVILHRIRECFSQIFHQTPEDLEMHLVYDVAHNIAKLEKHKIDSKMKELIVHRKGATRCFGPGRDEIAPLYRDIGQPVIVGGSMETGSYLCMGTEKAMEETFGTTMHGSGRTMSRAQAKREVRGDQLQKDMERRGIYVHSASMSGLAEEAGIAYKDISEVVHTMELAGVSRKVAALRPIGNIKG